MFKLKYFKKTTLIIISILILLSNPVKGAEFLNDNLIILKGTPEEIGKIWGKINKEKIKEYLEEFLADYKSKGLTEQDILEKAQKYNEIASKIAPWWSKEAYAAAKSAGVNPELYNAFLALKFIGTPKNSTECTSYLAVGTVTKNGNPILHKNRAFKHKSQAVYCKETKIPGKKLNKFIASGDVSDLGILMFLNDRGLAGVMDQGEPYSNPCYKGLPSPAILRYIAETCATCDEALTILKDIIQNHREWYTNGSHGSIWLFVDKNGKGLCVENTAYDFNCKFIENGFLSRGSGADSFGKEINEINEILKKNKGNITPVLFNKISRIPSISTPKYISGFTAEVSLQYPDKLSLVWFSPGRPSYSIYIPLFMGTKGVALTLIDGSLWDLMQKTKPLEGISELNPELKLNAIDEYELNFNAKNLQNEAKRLIKKNKIQEAEDILTSGCMYFTHRVRMVLKLLEKNRKTN